jgi:hypothetical protein
MYFHRASLSRKTEMLMKFVEIGLKPAGRPTRAGRAPAGLGRGAMPACDPQMRSWS